MKFDINQNLSLELLAPYHAHEIFILVNNNREYLRQWLPWLDMTRVEADVLRFIATASAQYKEGCGSQFVILHKEQANSKANICGIAGFHKIEKLHHVGAIGYWLDQSHNGQGIMTAVVEQLINVGFEQYALNRIEISCAVNNNKSRAIPQRLGFTCEATLRQCEWLYDHYVDHAVYSMLASDHLQARL